MNTLRSISRVASTIVTVLGVTALAPAAFAGENEGRRVRKFLESAAEETFEIEAPLPTRLSLKQRQDEEGMRDDYRKADFRRIRDRDKPSFFDFSRFEMGGFAGAVAYSSDFEADPSFIGGLTARVPVPGIPLGDWGAWASAMVGYIRRDLPFYYSAKSGTWYGLSVGGDYTFVRDNIWYLRGQAGILYAHWNAIQALDNGMGILFGMEFGFYWIKNYQKAVFGINPQLSYDGENAIFMLQLGFHVDF